MAESNYALIERQIESFPSLPSTVAEVINVAGDPESSANDLAQAILPDQSMCVSILKLANSALYGRPQKIGSLEKAIMVLGFNEVKDLVLSKGVISSFHNILRQNKKEVNAFWDHAFTCGLAARIIAEHMELVSGQFFMGGLIHDIGKLAILMTFPEEYEASRWMVGFSDQDKLIAEERAFGVSHQTVGRRILEKWNFPPALLMDLEYHHDPSSAPEHQTYPLTIQLADLLAHLAANEDLLEERDLIEVIHSYLPDLEAQWRSHNLPWVEMAIESWYAWVKIDRAHGSSIMQIFVEP